MRVQIRRLSPHQNGKVIAVLTAIFSVPLFLIMAVALWLVEPRVYLEAGTSAVPLAMFLILPFFYLIFVYLTVALVCVIYNACFNWIGGLELDLSEPEQWQGDQTQTRP